MVGDLWVADATKETLLGIWQNVIGTTGIDIRTGQKVVDVKRDWQPYRAMLCTGWLR